MPMTESNDAEESASRAGAFIVLEGIDGAGTTTQLERLSDWAKSRGRGVTSTFEPSNGPIGTYIRQALRGATEPPPQDAIALMFAADRLEHLARVVDPGTGRGDIVFCDRYVGSSLAYQGSLCEPAWVREINSRARTPDLTLYLRIEPHVALERVSIREGEHRDMYETQELLERISSAYDRVYGVTGSGEYPAVVIDASQSIEVVSAACRAAIEERGLM